MPLQEADLQSLSGRAGSPRLVNGPQSAPATCDVGSQFGLRMRQMTVMFTDMAGSTEFAQKFGARAAFRKRKQHNALLCPLIQAHHGTLVETAGDALLIVFDDVADAARCAIAMQRRLAEHNRSVEVDVDDLEIHVRIGMHTGSLVVSQRADGLEVAGQAVNIAARVETADGKRTDQILVSAACWSRLQANWTFRAHPLPRVDAKGIGELQVYRLQWQAVEQCPRDNTAAARLVNTRGARDLTAAKHAGSRPAEIPSVSRRGPQSSAGAARFLVASTRQHRDPPLKRTLVQPRTQSRLAPRGQITAVLGDILGWLKERRLSESARFHPASAVGERHHDAGQPTKSATSWRHLLRTVLVSLLHRLETFGHPPGAAAPAARAS